MSSIIFPWIKLQVKVWCTKQEASVLNIDMKANICCVKYNPGSSVHVAVKYFLLSALFLIWSLFTSTKFVESG